MKGNNQLDPVVVSSCIFLEDKTSEKQTDGIFKKLNLLKIRLRRLREVVEERFPKKIHLLTSDNDIDISKMGYGGTITTDTCISSRKSRRILVERIEGTIHEMDCIHHLRNVWFGCKEKALTCHLNVFLKDSLDNIDKNLRVSASMTALIRAFDKEFSLAAN